MQVQVNKSEIENLYNQMTIHTSDLYDQIKNYKCDLVKLKKAYKSYESKTVLDTFTLYLEKLMMVPNTYDELTQVIKESGNSYIESDSSFKVELERENNEDEK